LQNDPFFENEISDILKYTKNNSSPGRIAIPFTFWKTSNNSGIKLLNFLLNIYWKIEHIPNIFKIGTVKAIPKYNSKQYRPITIQSTIVCIFSTLINKRITSWCSCNNIPMKFKVDVNHSVVSMNN